MVGLPLHPLVVHFAVVLLTLVPLAAIVSVFWRRLRERLEWLLPLGGVVAGICGLIAGSSGGDLASRLEGDNPTIHAHMTYGDVTEKLGIAFGLLTVIWWLATGPVVKTWAEDKAPWLRSTGMKIASTALMVIAALATLVLVTLTGHSGATAVWGA